jgi:hypothetical protein
METRPRSAGEDDTLQSRLHAVRLPDVMARRNPLIKVCAALGAMIVLGYLFAHTLTTVSSEPYIVPAAHLGPWTIEIGSVVHPAAPVVFLRPPRELSMGVFDQVFQRTMESFTSSAEPGIPLVLYREVQPVRGGTPLVTPSDVRQLAVDVGLGASTPTPFCISVYRTAGGREQRLFFLLFDHPPFERFRAELGERLHAIAGSTGYRAEALSPAMLIASSAASRLGEVHSRVELESACEAPIESRN